MIIDFQIHYSPHELIKDQLGPGGRYDTYQRPDGSWGRYQLALQHTLEKHLELMDKGGVDIAVLSSMAGLTTDKLSQCRIVNDRLKDAEERYPGRIKGLAHILPFEGAEAFAELRRCREELGFKGAAMYSIMDDKELDDPAFWPYYEKLCEHGMFLFIHPYIKFGYSEFPDYDLSRSVYREGLLMCSLVRLINGGVLDDFPTLKIVFSHLGGGIAAQLTRVLLYQDKEFWGTAAHPKTGKKCKRDFTEYLDMMMFDTGGVVGDIGPVKMALTRLKPTSIVFGTDYPYEIREPETVKKFIADFRALPLPPEDIEAMLGGNGRRLIGV